MTGWVARLALPVRPPELSALAGLFLAGFLAFGVGVYAFTQFLNPVQAEFGWNRAVLGGLMSAFWMAAPFVLVAAYALEFLSIRAIVATGAALEAVGLVWMTHLTGPAEFFAVRFCMGVGKCLIVTPVPIAAARWFGARTAMACAIALSGWHVGGLVMAPLSATLILRYGWRSAAWILALILLLGMTLTTWLLRAPAEPTTSPARSEPAVRGEAGVSSFAHAWVLGLIAIGTLVYYAGYATFLSQLSIMLSDVGLSARAIAWGTGSVAVLAALGTLLGGVAAHKSQPYRAVGALLAIMAALELGAVGLRPGVGLPAVATLLIPLGLVIGGGDPILIEAVRRCTPPRYYNRCYGFWYLACLASLAAAPVLAGASFDRYASYRGFFLSLTAGSVITALLWITTTRAARRSRTSVTARMQPQDPQVELRFACDRTRLK